MPDNPSWWKQNAFGIESDDWVRMVKNRSQGAYESIWDRLSIENRARFVQILEALNLADFGRYGYSKVEALKEVAKVEK